MPGAPSAWTFSHRSGCLAGEAEYTRAESQALGCGGLPFPVGWPEGGGEQGGVARKASSCSFKGEMLPLLILIRQSPEGRKSWGPGNPIVQQICPPQGQDVHST